MTATLGDIDRYIEEGQDQGARWVIIAVDRWDHDNYPIYVQADEDFWDKYPDANNMQGVDEVYDLDHPTVSVEDQRGEDRARYMPPRPVEESSS
jgi:hypothetical protein